MGQNEDFVSVQSYFYSLKLFLLLLWIVLILIKFSELIDNLNNIIKMINSLI